MMKWIFRLSASALVILVIVAGVRFNALGEQSRSMKPPGLVEGRLAPCPDKPNCVMSDMTVDAEAYISPLDTIGGHQVLHLWNKILVDHGGKVTRLYDGYMAAEFTSDTFGFVDDVEVKLDPETGVLHIRSASRVGYSDLNVNRERVNMLFEAMKGADGGEIVASDAQ